MKDVATFRPYPRVPFSGSAPKSQWRRRIAIRLTVIVAFTALLIIPLSSLTWSDVLQEVPTLSMAITEPNLSTAAPMHTVVRPGVKTILLRTDFVFLLLVVAIQTTVMLIAAVRWIVLLRGAGQALPLRTGVIWYARACLADILPGQAGLELARATAIGRWTGNFVAAGVVQVAERVFGCAVLACILLTGLFWHPWEVVASLRIPSVMNYVLLFLVFVMAVSFFLLRDQKNRRLGANHTRLNALFLMFSQVVAASLQNPLRLTCAFALTTVIHGASVIAFNLLASAIGLRIPWTYWFLLVPLASISFVLPLSIAGFGVFEGVALTVLAGEGSATVNEVILFCALYRGVGFAQRLVAAAISCLPTNLAPTFSDINRGILATETNF